MAEHIHPHRAWQSLHDAFYDAWAFMHQRAARDASDEAGGKGGGEGGGVDENSGVVDAQTMETHLWALLDRLSAVGDFAASDFDWCPPTGAAPDAPTWE